MQARRFTLAQKITLIMLGLVLSTSVILIATFSVGNKHNMIQLQAGALEERVQYLVPLILRNVGNLTLQAQKLSELLVETLQFQEKNGEIENILKHLVKTDHFLLDASFESTQSQDRITVHKLPNGNVDVHKSQFLSPVVSQTGASFSKVFRYNLPEWQNTDIAALTLTWPVTLPNKQVLGTLIMTLNFQENITFAKELSTSKYQIYLINPDGEYFFNMNREEKVNFGHVSTRKVQDDYPDIAQVLSDHMSTKLFPKVTGHAGLAMHYQQLELVPKSLASNFIASTNWIGLVQVADYWEALNESISLRRKTYISAAILIFLAMLVAYWFSKIISRDLNNITDVALRFTRGETDIHLDIKSADEIGVLATAFQGMIHQVNERTRKIKNSEEKAQQAKDMMEEALSANQKLLENTQTQNEEIRKIGKEKDDLLAVVSHDLKNPLSVIDTSMSLIMESHPALNEEALDLIQRSKRGARFGLNLITDLLDIARLEGGIRFFPEIFDLSKLLQDCVQNFASATKDKKIRMLADVTTNVEVFADFRRLAQVVNNLLSNAIKFTPVGGSISIQVQEKFQPLHPPFGQRKILQITVKDTGIGVPKDKLDTIFNKYEQARAEDREIGTGLGLTICKNICELHNGTITVNSEVGKGTTFTLSLPILTQSEVRPEADVSPQLLLISHNVDEVNKLKQSLSQILGALNVSTFTRDTFLESSRPTFSNPIILADVCYPKIFDSIVQLKQSGMWNDVPIFMLAPKFSRDILDKSSGTIDGIVEWPSDPLNCVFALRDYFPAFDWRSYCKTNSVQNSFATPNPLLAVPKLSSRPSTILIVDDSDDTHQLLTIMMRGQPVELLHAYNGKEGAEMYTHHRPDLVLMDVSMPELDGHLATQVIRRLEVKKGISHTTILAITAADDQRSLEKCLQSGMDGAFPKPFSKSKLLSLISGQKIEKKVA